jgi:hypothetical protein
MPTTNQPNCQRSVFRLRFLPLKEPSNVRLSQASVNSKFEDFKKLFSAGFVSVSCLTAALPESDESSRFLARPQAHCETFF